MHINFPVISIILVSLAACGGDGPTAAAYVDAAMAQAGDLAELPNGRCVVTAIVDVVGPGNLVDAGIEPAEFAANGLGDRSGPGAALVVDRQRLTDEFDECSLGEDIIGRLDPGMSPAVKACVVELVDHEVAEAMTSELLDGGASFELDAEAEAEARRCRDAG
jgi:hypothetical protein